MLKTRRRTSKIIRGRRRLATAITAIDQSAVNWDDVILGTKGWNVGAAWAPMDNVGVILKYFNGNYITGPGDAEKLFARVEMFF